MEKSEIILKFKNYCSNTEKIKIRQDAINNKVNTDVWETDDADGMVRIFGGSNPSIIFFPNTKINRNLPVITANEKIERNQNEPIKFGLTPEEYKQLEGCYIGNLTSNGNYLKQL